MSIRKRLFKRKLIQARDAGKDVRVIVPKNMKNPKLFEMVKAIEEKIKKK